MVISGGNFKPDTLKPKEVVSLLLDDDELEKKCMYFSFNSCIVHFLIELCVSIIVNLIHYYILVRMKQEERKQLEKISQERKRKPEIHTESKVSLSSEYFKSSFFS